VGSPFESLEAEWRAVAAVGGELQVPVIPRTFYACGLNYEEHIRAVAEKSRSGIPTLPTQPDVGYRANNALIAQGRTDPSSFRTTPRTRSSMRASLWW